MTYAASFFAIWCAAEAAAARGRRPAELHGRSLDGFRFLKGRQALIGIFAVDTNAMVFGMPSALFPAIALHQPARERVDGRLLYAAPSAGALVCSLLSGWTSHVRRRVSGSR